MSSCICPCEDRTHLHFIQVNDCTILAIPCNEFMRERRERLVSPRDGCSCILPSINSGWWALQR